MEFLIFILFFWLVFWKKFTVPAFLADVWLLDFETRPLFQWVQFHGHDG
jgi:hypothetical protein